MQQQDDNGVQLQMLPPMILETHGATNCSVVAM